MEEFKKWSPPEFAVDKHAIKQAEKQKLVYQKEFESGYQAGLEKGLLEAKRHLESKEMALGQLMVQLNAELQAMTTALAQPMIGLVQTLVTRLAHEAHCLEPALIVQSVQTALSQVSELSGPMTVILNPEHYQCLLSYLEKNPTVLDKIQFKTSDAIQVGGCQIDAPTYFYDNTLDTQLRMHIQALLNQVSGSAIGAKAS